MGLICWLGGVYILGNTYTGTQVVNIFMHRSVMGFVISISALRMNWVVHGLLIGTVIGVLFILYEAMYGYLMWIIWMLIPVNAIYSLLVEYFTTKVFKSPVKYL